VSRPTLARHFSWLVAAALVAAAPLAQADFQIEEIYSSADGRIQYVVLHEASGANGLQALHGATLTSTHSGFAKTYRFTNDLPSSLTAGRRVLVATQGFAALTLIVPDYVLPDQFLATDAAMLDFAYPLSPPIFGHDQVAYASLPIDGTNALARVGVPTPNVATNFAGATAVVPALPVTVVEYYNPALDHYFISALQPDIDALDTGHIGGWRRTGFSFKAFPTQASGGAGVNPVCRFYIPPQHGNSHFFSASLQECADILNASMTDPNYIGYVYETPNAFYIALPDAATGACPAGTVPVYRLWNQRPDTNHRYMTDAGIKAQMIASGSVAEGYGPDKVDMCALGGVLPTLQIRASASSPFAAGCDGLPPNGILYVNAEVEPMIAINPRDPNNIVGVWQQDRWSNGGAPAMLTGASFDGGRTWTRSMAAFSRCAGGNPANGADYPRSSDPWVSFAPDGTVHQAAIAFGGAVHAPGSTSAVLASRSTDGGLTWSAPAVLISDTSAFFNDKDSISADPTDASLVYAVWDRLTPDRGPSTFARSTDSGSSWEPARTIYAPGTGNTTLNNQIVVLPDGTLIDFFTLFVANQADLVSLQLVRSADKGVTWSAPIMISSVLSAGTADPQTGAPVRDGSALGSIAAGPHGELAVTWQDARFSTGPHDGIAFSRSLDGGLTWSTPVGINAVPGVPAFEPSIAIRSDGTMGISYYDFRNNTASPATLPTDYWITRSGDGIVWRETHVSGSFDLDVAPVAEGLFLGDYQGLGAIGETFVPFFAQTNDGSFADPTDVFASLSVSAIPAAGARAKAAAPFGGETLVRARTAMRQAMTPEFEQRMREHVVRVRQRRLPGGPVQAPPR
jgi:hypothetical protein